MTQEDIWKSLRKQIQAFTDPKVQEALRQRTSPFTNSKLQEALRQRTSPFTDPKVQEALRKQVQPLADPSLRAGLLAALGPVARGTAFGSAIRSALRAFEDASLVAEIRDEVGSDVEAGAAVDLAAEAEAAVAVGAEDFTVADDASIRAWAESLTDVELLKFAVTTCDILTGLLLLLLGLLTPAGQAFTVVAAGADVLLRAARPLLDAVDKRRDDH